jgi:hypothetical protein
VSATLLAPTCLGQPHSKLFQAKLHSEAKSQQEKTTFENIISLANQISKWLLLALGNPTVNYFRQSCIHWKKSQQENTTTENIFSCQCNNLKGKFFSEEKPHNIHAVGTFHES